MEQFDFSDQRGEPVSSDRIDMVDTASDRRGQTRHISIMRVARLSNQSTGAEGLGIVRNISSGGVMIEARIATEIGHVISVSMLDDQCFTGDVVWKDGDRVGLHFLESVEISSALSRAAYDESGKRARLPRLTVNQMAKIKTSTASCDAQLCDVSQRGAKLKSTQRFLPNEQILLTMADCRPVRGTVRWHAKGYSGIEFHRLLGVDELALWLPVSNTE